MSTDALLHFSTISKTWFDLSVFRHPYSIFCIVLITSSLVLVLMIQEGRAEKPIQPTWKVDSWRPMKTKKIVESDAISKPRNQFDI